MKRKALKWFLELATEVTILWTIHYHEGFAKVGHRQPALNQRTWSQNESQADSEPSGTVTRILWHSKQLDKLRQRSQGVCGPCLNEAHRKCDGKRQSSLSVDQGCLWHVSSVHDSYPWPFPGEIKTDAIDLALQGCVLGFLQYICLHQVKQRTQKELEWLLSPCPGGAATGFHWGEANS